MNEWIKRQPFIVSTETHASFKRLKKQFNCKLCGHVFSPGDPARWIFANSTKGMPTGNFFVCGNCDGTDADVLAKAKADFELMTTLAKKCGMWGPDWQQEAGA